MADDAALGQRIRAIRRARGLSLETTAGLAGISLAMLSYVERGQRALERRSHIDGLAYALRISPAELLGQPYAPLDPERSGAQAHVDELRAALMGTELGCAPDADTVTPLADLIAQAATCRERLCRHGDSSATAAHLPDVITGLHAYVADGGEEHQVSALRALVLACCTACSLAKELGYLELAWIAAERARQAAGRLDDPVLAAMAAYHVAQALQPYSRCLAAATRALTAMEPHAGATAETMQLYGMLHLMAAHSATVVGRGDDAGAHLAEAHGLAERVGDRVDFEMYFGPTNLGIWRLLIAVEGGEGGQAMRIADGVPIGKMPSIRRQAMFHVDLGRAYVQERDDARALEALLHAEELSPVGVRGNPLARETCRMILHRSRTRSGRTLGGLAYRMGIA